MQVFCGRRFGDFRLECVALCSAGRRLVQRGLLQAFTAFSYRNSIIRRLVYVVGRVEVLATRPTARRAHVTDTAVRLYVYTMCM